MSDFRQMVVDAGVKELRHQLGDDEVDQHGTYVQVESGFKMARLAEHILRTALGSDNEYIIQQIAQEIAGPGEDWEPHLSKAADILTAVWGAVGHLMDPLP
ncbi:hypothetical protein SAMN05518849_11691 [Sphingobium sp. AP50]|uniref:hypothetical protein n=1 Tax=Sphingobium sp. AP50 TaxID=1884369 RepID=UPI0008B90EF8|nr:hypothetical protein [Sphingobium sp. AP50]SEJ87650.1 hypothetical protein SAMN05518849_11691 [Sphingobium sp. AP50]